MIEFVNSKSWKIANGKIKGDEDGEFTFTGARGISVIDYIILNEMARKRVEKFIVEERIESDHAPISVIKNSVKKKGILRAEIKTKENCRDRRYTKRSLVVWWLEFKGRVG